jgi:tetratricopeptide (TPR) repeat protein
LGLVASLGQLDGQAARGASLQPVALVVASADTSLTRGEDRKELTVSRGQLLFPGDHLKTTAKGSLQFAFCGAAASGTLYDVGPDGEIEIRSERVMIKAPQGSASSAAPVCLLPQVPDRETAVRDSSLPLLKSDTGKPMSPQFLASLSTAARAQAESIEAALRENPNDLLAMVARASFCQRNGSLPESAEEFDRIASAIPDQGWAKHMGIEITTQARPASPGKRQVLAVVIGISEYQDVNKRLQFAHRDATHFAEYLRSPRGGAVPEDHLRLLLNADADGAAVRRNIEWAFSQAGKNDSVVIFFSGHGTVVNDRTYLVPADCGMNNVPEKGYPMRELLGLIRLHSNKVDQVRLYIDACRAGRPDPVTEKNQVNLKVSDVLEGIPGRRVALFASKELAYEHINFDDKRGHGAFTYFLLRALNGPAPDAFIGESATLGELGSYLAANIPKGTDHRQYPKDSSTGLGNSEVIALSGPSPIQMGLYEPMPREAFKTVKSWNNGAPSAPQARDSSEGLSRDEIVRDEKRGRDILQRYLEGDEIPQKKEDFALGFALFSRVADLAPASAEIASLRDFFDGRQLIAEKQYDQASARLQRALRLDPDSAVAYNALGIVDLEEARYDESIRSFDDAIRRSPYWPYPRHNRALALTEKGAYNEAVRAYYEAMELAPYVSYLPYNLGLLYQRMNRKREAELAYQCADYLIHWRITGPAKPDPQARRRAGCPAARHVTQPLIRFDPGIPEARMRVAAPSLALGVLRNDERRLRQVVDTLSQNGVPEEQDFLTMARFDLANQIARNPKRFAEARNLWLLNLQPKDHAPSRNALAEALARQGGQGKPPDERARWIEEALHYAPDNPKVLIASGELEGDRGRSGEARQALRKALEQSADPRERLRIERMLRKLK